MTSVFSDDISEKAKRMKSYNFNYLLFLDVPLQNFGTEEEKKQYTDIKNEYARATGLFYERRYLEAYRVYVPVLENIEKLYERLSLSYIDRTYGLLQNSLTALVEVGIKYDKRSYTVENILTDIEVPYEKPHYDPKEFHFTYDKEIMVRNLDRSYLYIAYATEIRRRGIILENVLEKDRVLSPEVRLVRVDNYKRSIEFTRQAKVNAIYIYQLINTNKMLDTHEYSSNPYFNEKNLAPVFDKRIPDEYKLDANDSLNRVHKDEIELRVNLKSYDLQARDKDMKITPSTVATPAIK